MSLVFRDLCFIIRFLGLKAYGAWGSWGLGLGFGSDQNS